MDGHIMQQVLGDIGTVSVFDVHDYLLTDSLFCQYRNTRTVGEGGGVSRQDMCRYEHAGGDT